MRKVVFLILSLWCSLTAYAYQFTFDGRAAGKYPIYMEVDRNADGSIVGRYAYKSTLRDKGADDPTTWLYIQPYRNSKTEYIIVDSDGNIQEYWSGASFRRENGVNYFSVGVQNTKGNTFAISAQSTSKNTSSWAGSYTIYSEGYRQSPSVSAILTLNSAGNNAYTGTLNMQVWEDDENMFGRFYGKVKAVVRNGVMSVTLQSHKVLSGTSESYEDFFDSSIANGSVVAKITKLGSEYKFTSVGQMDSYLYDIIELTIVKTK